MSVKAEKVAAAFEQEHEVRIGADVFQVRAFGMRQLTKQVMGLLMGIMSVYDMADQLKAKDGTELTDLEKFQACGDAAFELVGLAIKQPVEYFDSSDPVDTLKAFATVVELNIPFFVKALGGELPKTIERVRKEVSKLLNRKA
jgi:hypothetical protein